MRNIGLIEKVRKSCKEEGVRFYFPPTRFIRNEGIQCNGYFDGESRTLAVAKNAANWFITLAHEYSHMMQWKEDCPAWKATSKVEFLDWLDPKLTKKKRQKTIKITFEMELDCEKRTTKLFRELGMDKKFLTEYIQKSNAYTMFYLFIGEHCKWYKMGKEPYQLKSVWSKFPKTYNFNLEKAYKRLSPLYWQCI